MMNRNMCSPFSIDCRMIHFPYSPFILASMHQFWRYSFTSFLDTP